MTAFADVGVASVGSARRIADQVVAPNDTPFGVGRHLRDAISARSMVANGRIHANAASLLLSAKEV